jgi:hypothetical protein
MFYYRAFLKYLEQQREDGEEKKAPRRCKPTQSGIHTTQMATWLESKPGVQTLMDTVEGREQFLRAAFKLGNLGMDFLVAEYAKDEDLTDKLLTTLMLKNKSFPFVHYLEWSNPDHVSNKIQQWFLMRWWQLGAKKLSKDKAIASTYRLVSVTDVNRAIAFADISANSCRLCSSVEVELNKVQTYIDEQVAPAKGFLEERWKPIHTALGKIQKETMVSLIYFLFSHFANSFPV